MPPYDESIKQLLLSMDQVANASVMGPEYATSLQQRLQANPELLRQIAAAAVRRLVR